MMLEVRPITCYPLGEASLLSVGGEAVAARQTGTGTGVGNGRFNPN
jgi:hypothetical protein